MRVPYSWLMEYLDTEIEATELAEILTMGGLEVEEILEWTSADGQASDLVLMTSVTSNRGDLLSMVGVARQAAALLDCGLILPDCSLPETEAPVVGEREVEQGDTRVTIEDPEGCPRYSALRLVGVEVRPSPQWLAHRLEAAGMRPISNVVDATNYVLWELGQPLHAFDHRLIVGGHIIVRRAVAGEKLVTIDGSEHVLSEADLVIADPKGAIALAGIMGGQESELRERTTDVLMESAHFNPTMIRRTAQRLGMSTEASYRFERYVDPNLTLPALARVARIIMEIAAGAVGAPALDVRAREFPPEPVVLRPARTNYVLGTALSTDEQIALLERLGLEVEPEKPEPAAGVEPDRLRAHPDRVQAAERLAVSVPTRRPDLEREIDLIEEIAIVHGYNNLPTTLPRQITGAGVRTRLQKLQQRVSEVLRGAGLCEHVSFSMMGACDLDLLGLAENAPERRALRLRDPAAENQELMRTTLLAGLLAAAQRNVRRRVEDVALFETGRVFIPRDAGLPDERQRLGALVMGAARTSLWNLPDNYEQMDFYWLRGVLEQLAARLHIADLRFVRGRHDSLHPGRTAELLIGRTRLGVIGEVAPAVQAGYDLPKPAVACELDLDLLLEHASLLATYRAQPRYPAARRDLAVVLDDDEQHTAARLIEVTRAAGGELLESVTIFDVYYNAERLGEGRKSVALSLSFRHPERTLTDEEVETAMASIRRALASKLGGEVRTW